jgi:pimeloyl-ACP methyl ester carboxylesterase
MTITFENSSRMVEIAPGRSLHYHEAGSGHPVVCLHGGGPGASGWANYSRNIAALAEHFRVLAFDLPQFGRSFKSRFDEDLYPAFGRVIDQALERLDIPSAHFIGNSMGGAVSCFVAHFNPARADRLVLMGPGGVFDSILQPTPTDAHVDLFAYYNPGPPTKDKLRRLFRSFVCDPEMVTEDLVSMRYKSSVEPETLAALAGYGIQKLGDVRPILRTIESNALVIWGLEDRILTLDTPLTYAKLMPNCEVLMYPKTGHWVQWERAEDFNRSAIEFLTRV